MFGKDQRIWTDKQIAIIRNMYENQEPIRKIADMFGVSKNSIVGVIWRHIKHYKKSGINIYRQQRQQLQLTRGFKHMIPETPSKDRNIQKYAPPATFEPRTYIPKNPIPMQELTETSCREIIGDPKNMLCCGEPIVQGAYCKHHAEINYKPHTAPKILTKGAS